MLQISKPWDSQPQEVVELLEPGIAFLGSTCADVGGLWTPNNGPTVTATPHGFAATYVAASSQTHKKSVQEIPGNSCTFLAVVRRSASGANQAILSLDAGSGSQRHVLYFGGTNQLLLFSGTGGSSQPTSAIGAFASTTSWYCVGGRINGTNDREIWAGGVLLGSSTAPLSVGTQRIAAVGGYLVNDVFQSGNYMSGDIPVGIILPRAMSDNDMAYYTRNPAAMYELFSPRSIWVPVSAGGGGTTVNGALGTAVASGFAGTVNANRTIAGALGAAVASGFTGAVNANRTIAGALGTATASGFQGAVSNTNDTTINGALGTAIASGLTGGVAWDRFISGLLGTATASGFAGTVETTSPTIGRPASDTSNSGWTASTGSDLYAMLDEVTPDSADYIVTTATGSICEMALNATAYPGTAAQKLRYRASSSTGNSVIVRLKNTGGATVRTETQVLTASDTLYEITLTAPEIAAITSGALSVELESA